ncbi:MAG TPA: hypothetical protein VJB70_01330 [Candidatus Paceibacterota bacterium]
MATTLYSFFRYYSAKEAHTVKGFSLGLCIFFFCIFSFWGGTRVVKGIQFEQEISGYLKRAADANTIKLAAENLQTALTSIQKRRLTTGYTSILWRTPDEDIGFWHTNLSSALQELDSTKKDATQLEKTNVLMKLRETLLDDGQSLRVTMPDGISIYPQNKDYMFWGLGGFLPFCLFGIIALVLKIRDERW